MIRPGKHLHMINNKCTKSCLQADEHVVGQKDKHKVIPTHSIIPTTKLYSWGHNYDNIFMVEIVFVSCLLLIM